MANPFGNNGEALRVNARHPLANFFHAGVIPRPGAKLYEPVSQQFFDSGTANAFSLDDEGFMRSSGGTVGAGISMPRGGISSGEPFTLVAVQRRDGALNGVGYADVGLYDYLYGYDRFIFSPDTWSDRHGFFHYDNSGGGDQGGYVTLTGSNNRVFKYARTNGTDSLDAGHFERIGAGPVTGAFTVQLTDTTWTASSYENLNFQGAEAWAPQYVLVFKKRLSDAELTDLFNNPGALIEKVPAVAPTTTGEVTDVSIDPIGTAYLGPWDVSGTGTKSHSVTTLPAGEGLIIALTAQRTSGVFTNVRLSVDGEPQKFVDDGVAHGMAFFPNITEAKQTIYIDYVDVVGGSINASLFRVNGHRKDKMLGTFVYSTNTPLQVTLEQEGSTLVNMATQWSNPIQVDGGPWEEWRGVWTPAYSNCSTYWKPNAKSGSYNSAGSMYDWAFFEILRGEKVRRKRFITVREPWTTQPQGNAQLDADHPLARYCTFLMGEDGSNVANNDPGIRSNINYIPTPMGRGNVAAFRSATPPYSGVTFEKKIPASRTSDWTIVIGADFRSKTTLDSGIAALDLACDDGCDLSVGVDDGFHAHQPTNTLGFYEYKSGSWRFGAYAENVLDTGPAVYVVTKSGTAVTIFRNGVNVTAATEVVGSPDVRSAGTMRLHKGGEFVYTNVDSPIFFCAYLDSIAVNDHAVRSLSQNPWQLFKPRRDQRIFTGTPVLTHKRRRML